MRGHLKKRVAGKALRRKRQRLFKRAPEAMPRLERSLQSRQRDMRNIWRSKSSLRVVPRIAGLQRKVARAGILFSTSLVYAHRSYRLWPVIGVRSLLGSSRYFALKTIRSLYRTESNRYFRKKTFRRPRKSAEHWYRHGDPKRGDGFRRRRRRNTTLTSCDELWTTAMHRRGRAYSLHDIEKDISVYRRSKRARRKRVREYYRSLVLFKGSIRARLLLSKNRAWGRRLRRQLRARRARNTGRPAFGRAENLLAFKQFRQSAGAYSPSTAKPAASALDAARSKYVALKSITGLNLSRVVALKDAANYRSVGYAGVVTGKEETLLRVGRDRKRYADKEPVRLVESSVYSSLRPLSEQNESALAISSTRVSKLVKLGVKLNATAGRVGKHAGAFTIHSRSRRARLNHFSLRELKYKKTGVMSAVARWHEVFQKKVETRRRVDFMYNNEATTLAPRMFGVFTYRTAQLNKVFSQSLGDTFRYIYLHRTYLDSIRNLPSASRLKSFVIHPESTSGTKSLLEKRIAEYLEVVGKTLKTRRSKNKPDYCYYTDARLYWDAVFSMDDSPLDASHDVFSVLEAANYHTQSALIELYKTIALVVYNGAILNG